MNSRKFAEPRRKNDLHWLEAVVPSFGLVACLMLLFPPWREMIFRKGVVFMAVAGAVFLGAVIALVARRLSQRNGTDWGGNLPRMERPLRSFDLSTLKSVAGEDLPEPTTTAVTATAAVLPAPAAPRRITLRLDNKPADDATKEPAPSLKAAATIPLLVREKKLSPVASLLERLRSVDWFQFEAVVGMMYEKQGYAVTPRGASAENGIDIILEKDGNRAAIHCKQWKTWPISEKSVRAFAEAVTAGGFAKGVLVLWNGCMGPARKVAAELGLEIVEEQHLGQMLEAMNAGSDAVVLALLNDQRKYCPKCESEMVLRPAKTGAGSTTQFWDCSTAPQCDYALEVS